MVETDPERVKGKPVLAQLSRFCYRRRRLVVVLWVVGFVVMNVIGGVVGNAYSDNFSGGHSDSISAFDLLKTRFPARAGDTADVVFRADKGVNDPAVRARMEALFAEMAPGVVPHVVALDSPYEVPGRVSRDGKTAYATVTFDAQAGDLPAKAAKPLVDASDKVQDVGLNVELSGPVVARAVQAPMGATEGVGLLAAVIILFAAFGSILAMSLPIGAAIAGVGIGIVLVALLSHLITVPSFAPYMALMIGLGVGIDYALLIVGGYRTGLHDDVSPEDANVLALTTSGRAVLVDGCTVIISLLGMFMMGINFIYGLSLGAILAVLMTMLASVTLVPAVMGFAGNKLATKPKKRRDPRQSVAYRWSRYIQRRPLVMAGLSLVFLLLLALPMFSIRLGVANQGNDPTSLTTRRAYDLIAKGFGPGANGPIILAADFTGSTNADTVAQFAERVKGDTGVA